MPARSSASESAVFANPFFRETGSSRTSRRRSTLGGGKRHCEDINVAMAFVADGRNPHLGSLRACWDVPIDLNSLNKLNERRHRQRLAKNRFGEQTEIRSFLVRARRDYGGTVNQRMIRTSASTSASAHARSVVNAGTSSRAAKTRQARSPSDRPCRLVKGRSRAISM